MDQLEISTETIDEWRSPRRRLPYGHAFPYGGDDAMHFEISVSSLNFLVRFDFRRNSAQTGRPASPYGRACACAFRRGDAIFGEKKSNLKFCRRLKGPKLGKDH